MEIEKDLSSGRNIQDKQTTKSNNFKQKHGVYEQYLEKQRSDERFFEATNQFADNSMRVSLANVDGIDAQLQASESGDESPYSTKIIQISEEYHRQKQRRQNEQMSYQYSRDQSDRSKKDSQEQMYQSHKKTQTIQKTGMEAVAIKLQTVLEKTNQHKIIRQGNELQQTLNPILKIKSFNSPSSKGENNGMKRNSRGNSKKKHITSGTRLLEEYQVSGGLPKVEQPSSKALLSKCKSQDNLYNGFPRRHRLAPSNSNGKKSKNQPIKPEYNIKSFKKAFSPKDEVKQDEFDSNNRLIAIKSQKAMLRISKQLRLNCEMPSNRILPYSPKALINGTTLTSPKVVLNNSNKPKGPGFGYGERKPYPRWMECVMKENPAPGSYSFSPVKITKGPSFGLSHKYYQKVMIPKLETKPLQRKLISKLHR